MQSNQHRSHSKHFSVSAMKHRVEPQKEVDQEMLIKFQKAENGEVKGRFTEGRVQEDTNEL